jgi:catechol 2,3-dioxygenase
MRRADGHFSCEPTALADALRRLRRAKMPIDRVVDHGVSEAVYVRDLDGNALEFC